MHFIHTIYLLNDAFYDAGMNQPTVEAMDSWWNLGYV